jgi:diguanylate cyclase (GGDEF)-like protein/PAS domain S-box-containing protein
MTQNNLLDFLDTNKINNIPIGWFEWKVHQDLLTVSKEIQDRFNLEAVVSIEAILDIMPDNASKTLFRKGIEQKLSTGVSPKFDYLVSDTNNELVWINFDDVIFKNEKGEIEKIAGMIIDVTDRKDRIQGLIDANNFYGVLMETIDSPIFYKNKELKYVYCNKAFSDFLGLEVEEIIGKTVFDMFSKPHADFNHRMDLEILRDQSKSVYEARVQTPKGEKKDMLLSKVVHLNSRGESTGIVGFVYDITERKYNEELIEKQNLIKDVIINLSHRIHEFDEESNLFEQLISQLLEVFSSADSGTILTVTEQNTLRIEASSGYNKALSKDFEIPLKNSFIWHHTGGNIRKPEIVSHIEQMQEEHDIPARVDRENKEVLRSNLYIPLFADGQLSKMICLDGNENDTFTNFDQKLAEYIQEQIVVIRKLYHLHRETVQLSRYDALTGFMNRGYFEAIFEDRIQLAIRSGIPLTIVVFDLDNLKVVNDTYGHDIGDDYIRQFAKLISDEFRSSDQIGRLGGDEFCCSFMDSDVDNIIKKLETIRSKYQVHPFGDQVHVFKGRFSYGVATFPEDGVTTYDLLKKADFDMYVDKKQNKI